MSWRAKVRRQRSQRSATQRRMCASSLAAAAATRSQAVGPTSKAPMALAARHPTLARSTPSKGTAAVEDPAVRPRHASTSPHRAASTRIWGPAQQQGVNNMSNTAAPLGTPGLPPWPWPPTAARCACVCAGVTCFCAHMWVSCVCVHVNAHESALACTLVCKGSCVCMLS